ncbi:hypothetical protein [Streptomyces sp. NPDC017993]|uniref:hypothetical protein n=1 Tax=Streptomyces sp. NPDC017993 TaxID=3365027 RepID=UPI0037B0F8BA
MAVPFYMVTTSRPAQWKAASSPFYEILRKRQFRLVKHVDFRGQGGGQLSGSVERGRRRSRFQVPFADQRRCHA